MQGRIKEEGKEAMTQKEQDRITGERLRSLTEKRKQLNCYEAKALSLAKNLEAVAQSLTPNRYGHQMPSEQKKRRRLWSAKLEGRIDSEDVRWPEWEEVSQTFREIEHLKGDIKRLVSELRPYGIE